MSPLSVHEARRLIIRVGCSNEVANLAEWGFAHGDITISDQAHSYFAHAGGTEDEWSQIRVALSA